MRKMRIPKASQIKGIRKALANRKTPRQFIPGLKKRLRKLTGAAVFLFALCGCAARPSAAQTPVIIQPTQQTLAPTGTLCTGTVQPFLVNNKNQTRHYASIITSGATSLVMQIFGVDQAGNYYLISDTATNGSVAIGSNPVLTATGYYPEVVVEVTCGPASTASFTLSYSGSSAASGENVGGYLLTQIDKTIVSGLAASGTANTTFQPPFGNSFGELIMTFTGGAGPSGTTVVISCFSAANAVAAPQLNFTVPTTVGPNTVPVPALPCPIATVLYTGGGASAVTASLDYVFPQPGTAIINSQTHITATTATIVKSGAGVVHTVVVGTPAAGTITLFDLVPGSCTGTPSTNVKSVITATATFPAAPEIYDTLFLNGICVKASATMDITVSYQ